MIEAYKKQVLRLIDSLKKSKDDQASEKNPNKVGKSALFSYQATKKESREKLLASQIESVRDGWRSFSSIASTGNNAASIREIQSMAMDIDANDLDGSIDAAICILELCDRLVDAGSKLQSIKLPPLPDAIRDDVTADARELEKCMASGCFRSATILCGRMLETALHRKYFDVTGQDVLEKNPGIGLGNLIAKLVEKNVQFDPGLTQQIHLINQVRVFSVHKKQEAFNPSKAQAEAMVLYTLDSLEKLFPVRKVS